MIQVKPIDSQWYTAFIYYLEYVPLQIYSFVEFWVGNWQPKIGDTPIQFILWLKFFFNLIPFQTAFHILNAG